MLLYIQSIAVYGPHVHNILDVDDDDDDDDCARGCIIIILSLYIIQHDDTVFNLYYIITLT